MTSTIHDRLKRSQSLLIDGRWCNSEDGGTADIYNPSNGRVITTCSQATKLDTEQAVLAARKSFDQGSWNGKTPAHRARVLWKVADLLEARAHDIATLESLDTGKSQASVEHGEVPFAAECFRYYAGWCTKIEGSTKQLSSVPDQDFHIYTNREAIGVAALIVPWNGPLVQASWKIAPALAAGCSVIVKPSELTPLSTNLLGELLQQAGVPDGVVNILHGGGHIAGQALAEHPLVDKVSFTGSINTGRKILTAAQGNLKKVSLELGGKSPVIVFNDADVKESIAGAAEAIFANAGQVCVAGSRLYVEETIYDEVVNGVVELASKMKVGPASDATTQMGPLISHQHLVSVDAKVKLAVEEGANIRTGGNPVDINGGYYYSPTVIDQISASMSIIQDEVFGPVLAATSFNSDDDILEMANGVNYGLAASIWTKDLSRAHRSAASIRAGLVWVNCHGIPDMALPFGGYKQSGWDRENGYESILQYTELKSVVVRL